MRELKISF
jgi:hypothetical protein